MLEYWGKYHAKLVTALLEHLQIVGITLLISLALAAVITLLIAGRPRLARWVVGLFSAVYSIPSLALFAILIPVMGIGTKTAIFVLVLYNQYLLIRNFLAGLEAVDPVVVESAIGMGMPPLRVLLTIKLPLMLPVIMAGVHLAVISTIGIATIAASINAGGIGAVLFDGLRTMNTVKIVWGSLLCAGLALLANLLLGGIQRAANKKLFPYREDTSP